MNKNLIYIIATLLAVVVVALLMKPQGTTVDTATISGEAPSVTDAAREAAANAAADAPAPDAAMAPAGAPSDTAPAGVNADAPAAPATAPALPAGQ